MAKENGLIQVVDIKKSFRTDSGSLTVFDGINFDVKKGTVVSLVGPNSCGKTTLVGMIAGISKPDGGRILISNSSPQNSRTSYIMQNSSESLFPWKACWDNISFSLELKGTPKEKRKQNAEGLVKELGLDNILTDLNQFPYQLSGGQKQACNIARAIMHEPELMLMDESFASLDYETTILLEDRLLEILYKKKLTTVLVSHNIEEATYLADKIIVLSRKPAKIVGIVDNPLGHPRNRDMLQTQEFFQTRNKVLDLFRKGLNNEH